MDMLFESEKQKEATERLLASVRVRTINSEIDAYLNEMLGYAKEIDSILEKNNLGARYLDRVSMIDKVDSVYLDEDLTSIDFRIKEEIEDLLKRINTRIRLVKTNDALVKEIEESYDVDGSDIDSDLADNGEFFKEHTLDELKSSWIEHPSCFCSMLSCGGQGIVLYFLVEDLRHNADLYWKYFYLLFKKNGINIDEHAKDLMTRRRYISYDEDKFINWNATPFKLDEETNTLQLAKSYVTNQIYNKEVGILSNLTHMTGNENSTIVDELNYVNERLQWQDLN